MNTAEYRSISLHLNLFDLHREKCHLFVQQNFTPYLLTATPLPLKIILSWIQ
jgi:hypothetical protein